MGGVGGWGAWIKPGIQLQEPQCCAGCGSTRYEVRRVQNTHTHTHTKYKIRVTTNFLKTQRVVLMHKHVIPFSRQVFRRFPFEVSLLTNSRGVLRLRERKMRTDQE